MSYKCIYLLVCLSKSFTVFSLLHTEIIHRLRKPTKKEILEALTEEIFDVARDGRTPNVSTPRKTVVHNCCG